MGKKKNFKKLKLRHFYRGRYWKDEKERDKAQSLLKYQKSLTLEILLGCTKTPLSGEQTK